MPYYQWYELTHAALSPARVMADAARLYYRNPLNPLAHTTPGKSMAAAMEVFERVTRRYGKPEFGIESTVLGAVRVPVREQVVWERPFCRLVRFEKALPAGKDPGPKLLIVAPLSGHYATLLRGTVETMLPDHDVYITDWVDARMVPLSLGTFDLDDYIDYVINMFHMLGGDAHVMAVCQPSVPVLAAVSLMEARNDPYAPLTMTLMGGPVDTRANPTAVNQLAEQRDIEWFRRNVIMKVPFPHPGLLRDVYPGFLQLGGFMSMNLDRHVTAHRDLFYHLVEGDGDSADKHRDFYDEYLAVMDLTAEFYLQTVETVFIRHDLPKGEMNHRGQPVEPAAVRNVALMTVEGEKDDISGVGQTEAAHALCVNIPSDRKVHYLAKGVGHYGVFNGSRFKGEIAPRIADFIRSHSGHTVQRAAAPGPVQAPATNGGGAKPASAVAAKSPPAHSPDAAGVSEARDDLTRIKGIGPKVAETLNRHGIHSFVQLATLSDEAAARVEAELGFPGRIAREGWPTQARKLAG